MKVRRNARTRDWVGELGACLGPDERRLEGFPNRGLRFLPFGRVVGQLIVLRGVIGVNDDLGCAERWQRLHPPAKRDRAVEAGGLGVGPLEALASFDGHFVINKVS